MARRQTTTTPSHAGSKLLAFLILAALIFWAGHDPAGAATLIRHIAEGIASAVHAASHARSTKQ
jgi:hypothetical protein